MNLFPIINPIDDNNIISQVQDKEQSSERVPIKVLYKAPGYSMNMKQRQPVKLLQAVISKPSITAADQLPGSTFLHHLQSRADSLLVLRRENYRLWIKRLSNQFEQTISTFLEYSSVPLSSVCNFTVYFLFPRHARCRCRYLPFHIGLTLQLCRCWHIRWATLLSINSTRVTHKHNHTSSHQQRVCL